LDLGGGRRGVDMGPSAVRIAGIAEQIAALGYRVTDKGDLRAPIPETREPRDPKKKYVEDIAAVCERVHQATLASLNADAIPILLGGDHSLASGSVAASAAWAHTVRDLPMGLLWIHAHGDMNTPQTTISGNVHGMPLAALLGQDPVELARIGGSAPKVSPATVVLIGVRNLDEREKIAV